MIEIKAIDLFVERDPEKDEEDEANSLISLRVPADREFSRQIKELGAKWDDAAKEWRLVGSEATIKQIGALCKAAFPSFPRRRNRLVAAQIITPENNHTINLAREEKEAASTQPFPAEMVVRVEFVVNRTIKNYRHGQNLRWVKVFRQDFEQSVTASGSQTTSISSQSIETGSNATGSSEAQRQYLSQLQGEIRGLEQSAAEAFEALLAGKKEAVTVILKEAGIEQE